MFLKAKKTRMSILHFKGQVGIKTLLDSESKLNTISQAFTL